MADDFVTICDVCTKGITRDDLKYANGKAFHNQCFLSHGKNFAPVDSHLLNNTTRARIELVQLKNLKSRMTEDKGKAKRKTSSSKKRRTKRKTLRKKAKSKNRKKTRAKSRKRIRVKRRKASRVKRVQRKHVKKRSARKKSTRRRR